MPDHFTDENEGEPVAELQGTIEESRCSYCGDLSWDAHRCRAAVHDWVPTGRTLHVYSGAAHPDPAVERLQREARALLTRDHSLPHDWTLQQVIEGRLDDINKLKWQVRDTCIRAEAAEASLVKAREALTKALELAELAEELTGNQADDEFVWSLQALFKQTLADLKAGDQP